MSEPPEPYDEATLIRLVGRYQRLVVRLAAAPDREEQEQLRGELRDVMDQLWPLLAILVRPLAGSWVRRYFPDLGGSGGVRDVYQSVITSMCLHLFDALTTHPPIHTPPVGPLLRRIARHRMIDELRYNTRHSPDHPAPLKAPAPEQRQTAPPLPLDAAALIGHPMLSLDLPLQLDDRLYQDECLTAIAQYWELRLSDDEWRIIRARLNDQPMAYAEIAALFTPPWQAATVRKRYSRIIADTREHLRALDLLPDGA